MALINGVAHAWSNVTFTVAGNTVVGISAISYSDTEEIQNNYGSGKFPISRSYGNVQYEGSMTLKMQEVEALQDATETGRIQDIEEFDVIVSYQPKGSNIVRTHILEKCRFTTNNRGLSQGDMEIEVELSLVIGSINWKG